ncbi:MAG: hypothetical protein GEU80_12130 [Dehalococcoidia bacterium]|nr:hypothetical protein [Dehalococcoidia bacterium]
MRACEDAVMDEERLPHLRRIDLVVVRVVMVLRRDHSYATSPGGTDSLPRATSSDPLTSALAPRARHRLLISCLIEAASRWIVKPAQPRSTDGRETHAWPTGDCHVPRMAGAVDRRPLLPRRPPASRDGGGGVIAVNGNFRARDGRRDQLVETVRSLGQRHAAGAARHDLDGTVHRALLDDLCAAGYHAAPIERWHGGGSHRLVDIVMAQAALAEYDAATALGIGMHLMVVGTESWAKTWPEWRRQQVLRSVAEQNALLNVLATEPMTGAPQGRTPPATALWPNGNGGWRLHGEKTYSTFAPVLTQAIVFCSIGDHSGDVGRVLVRMDDPAIAIEHTWDTVGMRATASHTVHFAGVPVSDADLLARAPFSRRASRPAMGPWFALPVAAAYLGIARASRDEAVLAARRPRAGQTEAAANETRRAHRRDRTATLRRRSHPRLSRGGSRR